MLKILIKSWRVLNNHGRFIFFIVADGSKAGVVRVVDKKAGSRKRISPIWIMKECRNKGLGQYWIVKNEDEKAD